MGRIVVSPRLAQWRDDNNGEVCVCLRTDASSARAFAAMREVVEELGDVLDEPELWPAVPLPSGAGYFFGASDDDYDRAYEVMVEVTRRRLLAAGLSGELYPFDTVGDRDPVRVLRPTGFLECFLCLPGHRAASRWWAPEDVVDALVDFVVDWCQWGDPAADVHVTTSVLFSYTANGEVARELLSLLAAHPHDMFKLTGVGNDGRFRHAVIAVEFGTMALVVGRQGAPVSGWRTGVAELQASMVGVAPHVIAGFIKRGRRLLEVGTTLTLQEDWVSTPHIRRPLLKATPRMADRYVPDAFGVQLLGPGHRDRLPHSDRWTITEVTGGRVVVEHEDVAAWYSDAEPTSEILAEARTDFASLLMRDELITQ